MGGFAALVSGVVKLAKEVTSTLQVEITLEPFDVDDANGNRSYKGGKKYMVVVEHRQRFVRAPDFTQQLSKASVQFIEPVEVKTEDRITMPNGDTPQILAIEGVLDPSGHFYAQRVSF